MNRRDGANSTTAIPDHAFGKHKLPPFQRHVGDGIRILFLGSAREGFCHAVLTGADCGLCWINSVLDFRREQAARY